MMATRTQGNVGSIDGDNPAAAALQVERTAAAAVRLQNLE